MARHLFVIGVPRSGTTIIACILNRHSKILLGLERFKYIAMRKASQHLFDKKLFEFDRLFDVRDADTNIKQLELLNQRDKYPNVEWIGDKIPALYRIADLVFARFDDPMIICMLRNALDVADSWQRRASSPVDRWPEKNDFFAAVDEWNRAMAFLTDLNSRFTGKILFVEYEMLFSRRLDVLEKLLHCLGLQPEVAIMRYASNQFSRSERILEKKPHFAQLRARALDRIQTDNFHQLRELSLK